MASLSEALGERVGPFPAWLWALGGGAALYVLAHRASSTRPAVADIGLVAGPVAALGSVAALAGPALQPNPQKSNGINAQQGAGLTPGAMYVQNPVPVVSGGDTPTISGYVGLPRITPYNRARGGPS